MVKKTIKIILNIPKPIHTHTHAVILTNENNQQINQINENMINKQFLSHTNTPHSLTHDIITKRI